MYLKKGNTTGKVKITLDPASGYINHPYYELGTTNITDFKNQVAQSTIQDVMFKSKDIIVVVNKDKVEKYLMPDAYKGYPVSIPNWLTAFDGILDAEIQISGLSANDPNPLHQPMSNGVKYLMTQVGTGYMYATDWGTGFNGNDEAAMDRLLMENNLINNGWEYPMKLDTKTNREHTSQLNTQKPRLTFIPSHLYAIFREATGRNGQRISG